MSRLKMLCWAFVAGALALAMLFGLLSLGVTGGALILTINFSLVTGHLAGILVFVLTLLGGTIFNEVLKKGP